MVFERIKISIKLKKSIEVLWKI